MESKRKAGLLNTSVADKVVATNCGIEDTLDIKMLFQILNARSGVAKI